MIDEDQRWDSAERWRGQIDERVMGLTSRLDRFDTKFDSHVKKTEAYHSEYTRKLDDILAWRNWLLGASAVTATVVTVLLAWFKTNILGLK